VHRAHELSGPILRRLLASDDVEAAGQTELRTVLAHGPDVVLGIGQLVPVADLIDALLGDEIRDRCFSTSTFTDFTKPRTVLKLRLGDTSIPIPSPSAAEAPLPKMREVQA